MGDDTDAETEAKKALDLSKHLPAALQLLVEGINREMMGQWEEAAKVYQGLWNSSQNKLEFGLLLADAQKEAGRFSDAFSTLDALKKLPPPDQYDPRIQLQKADVAEYSQDYVTERVSAEAAAKKANELGASRVFAEAEVHQGWALISLGQLADARKALMNAYDADAEAGDKGGVADALNGLGDILWLQGDLRGAEDKYRKSMKICEELGYERMFVDNLCDMGDVLREQNDLPGAEKQYQQCLEKSRASAYKSGVATALLSLAELSLEQRPPAPAVAQKYLDELQAHKPEGIWDLLALKITTARRLASSSKTVEAALARQTLEAGRDEAKKRSFLALEFEARLALAQTEMKSGDPELGRRHLRELQRDASAKGFLLVARKAANMAKQ